MIVAGEKTPHLSIYGVRCSSMVRVFAHGAMGHWIDPSWCSTTVCNKGCGMCYPVCEMRHIKELYC